MGDLSLRHYVADGHTQVTDLTLSQASVGITPDTETPSKMYVQSMGDEATGSVVLDIVAVGTNDGSTQLRIGLDTASVMPPYGLAYTLSAAGDGGVWAAPATVYYVLTATNALGETVASIELPAIIDVATKRVILTWPVIAGATGYKLYRSPTAGTYGATSLRATIASGATLTYTDNGGACGAGTPSSANTTGGAAPAYGTAPALSTTPITLGVLAPGQVACYWLNRIIPGGTSSLGNRRQANLHFREA